MLDIDETYDAVHGGQQLALFNTHAGTTCFQPIMIFEAGTGKPVTALPRPGKTPSGDEIATILRHVIRRITKHWPGVKILVRGDSHYGCCPVLDMLEDGGCDYILGGQINLKLKAPWPTPGANNAGGGASPTGPGSAACINSPIKPDHGASRAG